MTAPRGAAAQEREGRVLAGRYRLVSRVDEGGAGEVWRARDERLERDVAVKLLGEGADPAFRERFTEEARRAAVVQHPNVVTVFDQGKDGKDAFMVMEYVRGRTLRDLVGERGALGLQEAARLVAQTAEALEAAHAAGVIHCDVKPANIILDDRGIAKLTDFGVARAARGPAEHELLGTPRYIAPERIEGKPATQASDVYGLGLVAYELIAGRPALEGLETEDLMRERLEGPPPSLRRARLGIPADVDLVVAKALARDPSKRYQSASEFARDLLAAVKGEHTQTMSVVPPKRLPRRRTGFGVALPPLDSAVALLAVIVVVLAVALLFMRFPEIGAPPGQTPAATATAQARVTPNVVGLRLEEAANRLIAAGFRAPIPWQVDPAARGQPCTVVRQEPASGSAVTPGSSTARLFLTPGKCGDD